MGNSANNEFKVASLDGTAFRALAHTFEISGYPSIFHIKDGQVRDFSGKRELEELKEFAIKGWEAKEPKPWYNSPLSEFGTIYRWVLKAALLLEEFFKFWTTELKYSELSFYGAIFGGFFLSTFIIIMSVGVIIKCIFCRKRKPNTDDESKKKKE